MRRLDYLLDTNSCIYLLARVHPSLEARVSRCDPGSVGLSAIVCAELMRGFSEADAAKRGMLERFLALFPVASFDKAAAGAYERVPFRRGKLDRLIAAHVLSLDAILVTNNVRDFEDVPGLRVEDWT